MIKNQKKTIIISVMVIILAVAAYFVLKATVLKDESVSGTDVGPHGETIINNRPLIVDKVEKADIAKIAVHNEKGGFTLYRSDTDGELYIEGAEDLYYNSDLVSELTVDSGYLLAIKEIEDHDPDLSVYGLDPENPTNYFELTTTDGKSYTVYIGDLIVTQGGYYVMLEGRDAVYILDNSISRSLLASRNDYLLARVAVPVPQSSYYSINGFRLLKGGERFMEIDTSTVYDADGNAASYRYSMLYPADYVPSSSNYGKVLSCFIDMTGSRVAEYGLADLMDSEEGKQKFTDLLTHYGFFDENGNPCYELKYVYEGNETDLFISHLSDDGVYYVCSARLGMIAEFKSDSLSWLEWDLIKWVDSPIYQKSINDVKSFEMISYSTGKKASCELEGEGDGLKVTVNGETADTANFRQLYKQLLYCANVGYGSNDEGYEPSFEIKITMDSGDEFDYVFYDIATLKTYYTVNGEGAFYISRDYIKKMNADLTAFLSGEPTEAKSQS